jgi:hypothetical protein
MSDPGRDLAVRAGAPTQVDGVSVDSVPTEGAWPRGNAERLARVRERG